MITHGYLVGDMSKVIKDGEIVKSHQLIERATPYGVILFDIKVVMKYGKVTVCALALRDTDQIPVGEPFTTP